MRFRCDAIRADSSRCRKDVGMTVMTEERPIFENEDWLVTEGGLEHKTTGYFIARESLGQRRDDGLWSWPLHMAEKSWCAMMPFVEAFSCAAAVYGVRTDADLAQTFRIARSEISPWPRLNDQAFNPAPLISQALRPEGAAPILWEAGSREKCLDVQGLRNPDDGWRVPLQKAARPFSVNVRLRPSRLSMVRAAALPWRAPRRIRRTGTKLVRLIQAAWNIR